MAFRRWSRIASALSAYSLLRADAEGGIRFNDPRLGIAWPLPPGDLSQRIKLMTSCLEISPEFHMNCRHCRRSDLAIYRPRQRSAIQRLPTEEALRAPETWYPLRVWSALNAGWCRQRITPTAPNSFPGLLLLMRTRRPGCSMQNATWQRWPSVSVLVNTPRWSKSGQTTAICCST